MMKILEVLLEIAIMNISYTCAADGVGKRVINNLDS